MIVRKTKWDEAYRADCCRGKYTISKTSDPNATIKYCDPTWCMNDPTGACATVAETYCGGADPFCDKSAMLIPNKGATATQCKTADECYEPWELQFCNMWYLNARQINHPSRQSLSLLVEDYCRQGDSSVRGECACYNAVAEMHQG